MRHRIGLDRGIRESDEQYPCVCEHEDCKRVVWEYFEAETPPDYVITDGCFECGRRSKCFIINAPDDTIMLDENDDPIPKDKEDNIPVAEG